MILRSPSGIGGSVPHRHADLAGEGRAVRRREGLQWCSGCSATTTQSTSTPGTLTWRGLQRAALGDALDLRDDDAAAVVRRHRDRQRLERQRLALHRQVAVGVGGGGADDADVDREGLVEQALLAVDRRISSTRSSVVRALILPPPWRGSTKVPRPTRLSVPGLAGRRCRGTGARSRPAAGCRPRSRFVHRELPAASGTSPQWPPIDALAPALRGRSG